VFNTVIPPGLQPFVKQLYESGFQKNGGVLSCVYYDENLLNYHPAQEMEGLYSCPRLLPVDQGSVQHCSCRSTTMKKFHGHPSTCSPRARPATGMYRGIQVLRSRGQEDERRSFARGSRGGHGQRQDRAGAGRRPPKMVPGKMHCKMNMYIAQCKVDAGQDPLRRYIESDKMVDPKEC